MARAECKWYVCALSLSLPKAGATRLWGGARRARGQLSGGVQKSGSIYERARRESVGSRASQLRCSDERVQKVSV